jgi:hypothetical protein
MRQLPSLVRFTVLVCTLVALDAGTSRSDQLYAITGPQVPMLQRVDPTTGVALTSTAFPPGVTLSGLCADGTELLSIDGLDDNISDRLFRIEPLSGAGTNLGNTLFNWSRRSCDVHLPSNTIYAVTATPGPTPRLFRIDRSTGAATLVATSAFVPGLDQVSALAISPSGEAYVSDLANTSLFRMDLVTGALTFIGDSGPIGVNDGFSDLAFDSIGRLWGVRSQGGLYRIDTETAIATKVANSARWSGIAFVSEGVVAAERTTWSRLKQLYR